MIKAAVTVLVTALVLTVVHAAAIPVWIDTDPAIGEPERRFQEDKLRLLRAVRIATRFELTIEPATQAAIQAMAAELPVVSVERIGDDLKVEADVHGDR